MTVSTTTAALDSPFVVFVNPGTWRAVGDLTVPWSLVQVGGVLPQNIRPILLDQRLDRNWLTRLRILASHPNCLAVGITGLTGLQLIGAAKAAVECKKIGKAPVVFGGVHATILPHQSLSQPGIDYVVVGEGEEVFVELVKAIESRSAPPQIPGLLCSSRPTQQTKPALVPQLALPAHWRFNLAPYAVSTRYGKQMSVLTSRGCPIQCAFCIYSNKGYPGKWRGLSPVESVELLAQLHSRYGVNHFHIQDDNFFVDLGRVEQIVELLLRQKKVFTWTVGGAHVRFLRKLSLQFYKAMADAGCRRVLIGAESGSDRILERIQKKQTVEDLLYVNRLLKRANIRPIYSFISGIPGENKQDLVKTVELMVRLRRENPNCDVGTIKPLIFYPGTKLYDFAVDSGYIPPMTFEGWSGVTWDNYRILPYPWLDRKDREFLLRLYYTSIMWNPEYHWINNQVFSLCSRLLYPITDWRMKRFSFRAMVLPRLLEWIQHTFLPVPHVD